MKYFILVFLAFANINSFYQNESNRNLLKNNDLGKSHLKGFVKKVIEYQYEAKVDSNKLGQIQTGKIIDTFIEEYNKAGNLLERFSTSKRFIIICKYDSEGSKIEEDDTFNDTINLKNTRITYNYDSTGKQIEEVHYNLKTNIKLFSITFVYDEIGNKIEDKYHYNYGEFKAVFKYNEKGDVIEKNDYHSDDRLMNTTFYSYNKDGYIMEEKFFEKNHLEYKQYFKQSDFDKIGNPLKEIHYWNDEPEDIRERVIEYY